MYSETGLMWQRKSAMTRNVRRPSDNLIVLEERQQQLHTRTIEQKQLLSNFEDMSSARSQFCVEARVVTAPLPQGNAVDRCSACQDKKVSMIFGPYGFY